MQNIKSKTKQFIPIKIKDMVGIDEDSCSKRVVNYVSIGNRIRIERELFHMSREKLSELLDISSNFLGQIERGERKMSIKTLVNISVCLHTPIDYLIFGKENNKNTNLVLHSLLNKCSDNESKLFHSIIILLLPHLVR